MILVSLMRYIILQNILYLFYHFFFISAVVFIHDYHPRSTTLADEHFKRSRIPVDEEILWSYLVQIVSALRVIHSANLACRLIHSTKIILTGKNRIRITGVGIFDVINYKNRDNYEQFQVCRIIIFGN